jgi:hypothetical protein
MRYKGYKFEVNLSTDGYEFVVQKGQEILEHTSGYSIKSDAIADAKDYIDSQVVDDNSWQ